MKRLLSVIATHVLLAMLSTQLMSQSLQANDTSRVRTYLAISDKHYYADRMDSAEFYCLKAGELARALNDKQGIADFVSYYIPILNRMGRYQEGLDLALEGLNVSKDLDDNSMLAMAYNNAGNQYQYLGDLKASATHYLNALIFSENADSPKRRMLYSNNLASVFLELEEKSKSTYYAKKSFQLALESNDSIGMASSLVNLALSEVLNEKFDDAIKHLDQVLNLGKALNDDSYVLDALINKADVYSKLKRYSAALNLYETSRGILKDYPVPDYELYVYWGLAQNHFQLGSYGRAEENLKKAIRVATELQTPQELSKLYLLGSEIYEKMNSYSSALSFRKQYEVLNDSIVGIETRRNIHRSEIEYQTSQKEKAIADQQLIIARNNLEIERKDKSILLWSAIAILLLSGIVIFVLIYRNKQRINAEKIQLLKKQNEVDILNAQMEGEEKERLRLARELHDGVGGILSASKMHLSILQDEAGPARSQLKNISSMLDHASQEIRTIAHNLFPDILLMNELHVALASFCERVKNQELNIDYYSLGDTPKLDNRFKLMVYRAVQELINNVIKHAKARNVLVQLSCHDNMLTVVVEDDGVGFSENGKKGIGLESLKQKVGNMGGQMSVETEPGRGTTVQIEFDISHTREKAVPETSILNT